jgi:hypothetical protein
MEGVILIREIPTWVAVPFGIVLAGTITWVVRWILRSPTTE